MIVSRTAQCHGSTSSSAKLDFEDSAARSVESNDDRSVILPGHFVLSDAPTTACAAARRAIGTRNGEQLT